MGSGTTNIAAEQLNRQHLEVCVKKLEDDVYRDRDTYYISGDWTMNGVRYDNHYVIWFYVVEVLPHPKGWGFSPVADRE